MTSEAHTEHRCPEMEPRHLHNHTTHLYPKFCALAVDTNIFLICFYFSFSERILFGRRVKVLLSIERIFFFKWIVWHLAFLFSILKTYGMINDWIIDKILFFPFRFNRSSIPDTVYKFRIWIEIIQFTSIMIHDNRNLIDSVILQFKFFVFLSAFERFLFFLVNTKWKSHNLLTSFDNRHIKNIWIKLYRLEL